MKLNFRDLKQQKFVIEAEPSETIGELKAKVQNEKGWESSTQKLIYSGKILQDDKTIESYSIEEKGFIVCMTQKAKPAPAATSSTAAAPSTPAAPVAATPAPPPAPVAAPSAGQNVPATPSPAPASVATGESGTPSGMALGEERAAAIASMEGMGFAREEIDRAMRAAFFNPDRAVEYLLNGIPAHLQRDNAPQAAQAPTGAAATTTPASAAQAAPAPVSMEDQPFNMFDAAAAQGQQARGRGGPLGGLGASAGAGAGAGASAGAGAGAGGVGNLDFLRNNPQFQQLRQLVQQQPQMLEPILQQVGAGNPQLAQLIAQHPEQFLSILAEAEDDDQALPPGAQAISVTDEERDAIERLCRLGFERDLVIQAYFACDKNEELAANFLFDQPDDDEGQ